MGPPPVKAKDSMKSTWRTNRDVWWLPHYAIHFLGAHPTDLDKEVPVFPKTAKVPATDALSFNVWIILHAVWPMAIQYAYNTLTGKPISPLAAFLLYLMAMRVNALHEVAVLRRLGHQYGFLDGDKAPRDQVPDSGVAKTLLSMQLTTAVRPLLATALEPSSFVTLTPWIAVEIILYPVVLDFFFYTYHRACHEYDSLWKYHRTHHLSKHPSPVLSAFSDWQQELIEIALVPLLTYGTLKLVGLPITFHDWWICHEYIIFTEVLGHSGLRLFAYAPHPLSPVLDWFDCELSIEDHDLHHRVGWKKSHNYGKQTRVWDRLFGTCTGRIETAASNIDWSQKVKIPLL
ncbi:hypothetical protein DV735_g3605, partial [Chaetothyriales sp. CBS 134920]